MNRYWYLTPGLIKHYLNEDTDKTGYLVVDEIAHLWNGGWGWATPELAKLNAKQGTYIANVSTTRLLESTFSDWNILYTDLINNKLPSMEFFVESIEEEIVETPPGLELVVCINSVDTLALRKGQTYKIAENLEKNGNLYIRVDNFREWFLSSRFEAKKSLVKEPLTCKSIIFPQFSEEELIDSKISTASLSNVYQRLSSKAISRAKRGLNKLPQCVETKNYMTLITMYDKLFSSKPNLHRLIVTPMTTCEHC